MSEIKMAVVGAGSFVFGSSLLAEALETLRLDNLAFELIDPNREAAEAMAAFGEGLARRNGLKAAFRVHDSFEAAGALDGADFVVHAAAPQLARRYQMDCAVVDNICPDEAILEFGGVAGISYSLRQIHLVEKLAARMRRVCPQAWLLCTANPLPRVCQAAHEGGIRTIGLCSAWLEGYTFLSGLLGEGPEPSPWKKARSRWKIHMAGLNHFCWADRIDDLETGADILPQLLDRFGTGSDYGQPLCLEMSLRHGAWLLPNDHHVRDFLPAEGNPGRREFPMHGSPEDRARALGLLRDAGEGRIPLAHAVPHPSWERPMRVVAGLALGRDGVLDSLNLANTHGQIPGLPGDVFVETGVECRSGEIIPRRSPLSGSVLPMCRRTARVSQMIVRAARERSRTLLQGVCAEDPTIRDPQKAFQAVEACLQVHADLIPSYD